MCSRIAFWRVSSDDCRVLESVDGEARAKTFWVSERRGYWRYCGSPIFGNYEADVVDVLGWREGDGNTEAVASGGYATGGKFEWKHESRVSTICLSCSIKVRARSRPKACLEPQSAPGVSQTHCDASLLFCRTPTACTVQELGIGRDGRRALHAEGGPRGSSHHPSTRLIHLFWPTAMQPLRGVREVRGSVGQPSAFDAACTAH